MVGRGRYPIKFNGNLFTVGEQQSGNWDSPDYRLYGGYYWHQNTRQSYWSMLGSGDYDLMQSLFRMYTEALPLLRARTQAYWGHGGAIFPETLSISGLFPSSENGYGCGQRVGEEWPANSSTLGKLGRSSLPQPRWFVECSYIRYHYNSAIEVGYAMAQFYSHTRDASFAAGVLVPFAREVAAFYLSHYQSDSPYDDGTGKITLTPSQSLETWQVATNPAEQIAGLHALLQAMAQIPDDEGQVPAETRRVFQELERALPELPVCTAPGELDPRRGACPSNRTGNGSQQQAYLTHAEYWARNQNSENPELYAVFPYRLFSSVEGSQVGRETFHRRKYTADRGEWQGIIQAALLGLTEEFRAMAVGRLGRGTRDMRFPGFYGRFTTDDNWVPDEGHASIFKNALQCSLVYSHGDRIVLFAAWPEEWDADFKLHAAGNTTVEATCTQGILTNLVVTPASRRKDVVFSQSYCNATAPPGQ